MGKKGTKRKTKWRTLPLGEETGGSGNEEELHDEDQSTTSSVVGQPTSTVTYKSQTPYCHKMAEKPFRSNRRFSYERYKSREPLVKLERKTFDEEEYTKITTPRQDVLFKKGYFGRKKESSVEETSHHIGEIESEEPMMDQIIITNGFVDERGHYLVNGNSYEIYDPYSNTVTVVVGPPPYTNGVTQPVLAAVSCQPVPLQPVDWYPPGSDWPSQGSAWTPSYPRTPTTQGESVVGPGQNTENQTDFHGPPEPQIPNLYQQPAYVVPGYMYSESPVYNGEMVNCSPGHQMTETLCSNENKIKTNEETSIRVSVPQQKELNGERIGGELEKVEESSKLEEEAKFHNPGVSESPTTTFDVGDKPKDPEVKSDSENSVEKTVLQTTQLIPEVEIQKEKKVEKQSHSTQTTELEEKTVTPKPEVPFKESHSTQTLPELTFISNKLDIIKPKGKEKNSTEDRTASAAEEDVPKVESTWKNSNNCKNHQIPHQQQQHHHQEQYSQSQQPSPGKHNKDFNRNTSPKKYSEESPRKIYQKRTNFSEEKKLKMENGEKSEFRVDRSPLKISYAKKAMAGIDATSEKNSKVVNGVISLNINNHKMSNGLKNAQNSLMNGNGTNQQSAINGLNRVNYTKQISTSADRYNAYDDKRNHNGNVKNGFVKAKYNKNYNGPKTTATTTTVTQLSPISGNNTKDFRFKEKKIQLKPFEVGPAKSLEVKRKLEETVGDLVSPSEKSSTISELSSPTELSSGQNTPPEKLIVRKMEQKIANEINKSFEEKLKQNLTKKNDSTRSKDKERGTELTEEREVNSEDIVQGPEKGKNRSEGKKKSTCNGNSNSRGRGDVVDKPKETNKAAGKRKKKKPVEEANEKTNASVDIEDNSFLPNLIMQEPQELIFRSWEGMKSEEAELISKMDSMLPEDGEILKTLGLNEDKMNFSKLRLHSDLLMMLPAFGWNRPKFKIEDMFMSTKQLQSDLFTRRNITSMKSTKPEEFFASVVDFPVVEKSDKTKKESNHRANKGNKDHQQQTQSKMEETGLNKAQTGKEQKSTATTTTSASSPTTTTLRKTLSERDRAKGTVKMAKSMKSKVAKEEIKKKPEEVKDKKLGIVEAVNTWLQEQGDTQKVLSVETLQIRNEKTEAEMRLAETEIEETEENRKNGIGNPMHALSGRSREFAETETRPIGEDCRRVNECMRVANVITDGLTHKDKVFGPRRRVPAGNRKPRSSSLDGKITENRIRKHLRFLTESASLCQDLISDVRNGLPARGEYATEELCDPRQSVLKYYTLSPRRRSFKSFMGRMQQGEDSDDSENEAFDALEYKFLSKETEKSNSDRNSHTSKDSTTGANRDTCKLQ